MLTYSLEKILGLILLGNHLQGGKMLLSKIGIVLLLILFLVSCVEDDISQCSSDFVVSYEQMQDAFKSGYRPFAANEEKEQLVSAMESFLASHENVECSLNGKVISPTGEVSSFLKELNESKFTPDFSKFISKVIYGIDNRRDVSNTSNQNYIDWSKSTLAQMEPSNISSTGEILSSTLGESFRLCSSERFVDQKNPARCSGFLVGPDILVTAGHCVQSQRDCESTVWVIDFNSDATRISQEKIFKCKELVSQELSSETLLDYAVIKLDRSINDRKFFRIQSQSKVNDEAELVVIGHPSGLPTKIADGGKVRENSNPYFFSAALDTYGGNSGSAVINAKTGVVEGILVRGEVDYVWSQEQNCRISNVCDENSCRGEDVTRMSQVSGIVGSLSEASIMTQIFDSTVAPSISSGWFSDFQGIERSGYIVGGKSFLGICGIHLASVDNPQDWEDFYSGSCGDSSEIKSVVSQFIQKLYF